MSPNIRIVLVEPSHPGNIGAVARAMKNMALELGRYDITCNAIGPGVIDTPMTKDLQESKNFDRMMRQAPLKRIGKPVDVANTALFLASEEGSYFTGSILHPDGGFVMQ